MPTIPPAGARHPAPEPHRYRQFAESFGVDAERYDRARPRYPDALVTRIATVRPGCDVAGRPAVLDVGCGTGIVSRQLQAAGCTVLGVDADARMAEFARSTGVEVEVGTFEAWNATGREFDAVVAGTAWHWVDPVAGAAKAAQVLRPGGRLAAFWNASQLPPGVLDAFAAVYERLVPDSPFASQAERQGLEMYQGLLTRADDGIRAAGGFGVPERWRYDWECTYTRDEWLDHLPTRGSLTQLPADQLAEVLESVGAAIDAMGGGFTMRYATVAVTATRTGGA